MLKLVRLALTAAILTAIAVRLRRRARMPGTEPVRPAPPTRGRGTRMGVVWAAIAAIVIVTLTAALVQGDTEEDRAADRQGSAVRMGSEVQLGLAAQEQAPQEANATFPASTTPFPSPGVATPSPRPEQTEIAGCSPAPRPVTVRPVDPGVRHAVDRQWRRIERWLKANAPRTYRSLGTPGRAHTIAVAESQMGVDFPDDLRASLLRHNGSRGAAGFGLGLDGAVAMGIREIRDAWRGLCSADPAGQGTEQWNGRLIPFLADAGGEHAVVDSAGGAVGWDGAASRMPSYYALMRAVADALEEGGEIEGRRPAVEGGVLRWETP